MIPHLSVTLAHYLVISGLIFGIGTVIALSKRNAVAVLMGVELMLNAVNLTLLAVALAMAVLVYRQRETVDLDRINLLRG